MNIDTAIQNTMCALAHAHLAYAELIEAARPDAAQIEAPAPISPQDRRNLAARLLAMRDPAHALLRTINRRLHAILPAEHPDPDRRGTETAINWSALPIHESEPHE